MQKAMPGNKNVVFSVFLLCSMPLNILYRRDNAYPAKKPINTHNSNITFIKPPQFEGERKPRTANIIVTSVMVKKLNSSAHIDTK